MKTDSYNYYSYNHRGDMVLVTDASGDTTATYEYTAFGEPIASSESTLHDRFIGFSSKEYDVKSGLSYYGFRYYDPSSTRWMKKDPIGWEGGINLYGFVYNNPVFYFDDYGKEVTYPNRTPTQNIKRRITYKGPFHKYYFGEFGADSFKCCCESGKVKWSKKKYDYLILIGTVTVEVLTSIPTAGADKIAIAIGGGSGFLTGVISIELLSISVVDICNAEIIKLTPVSTIDNNEENLSLNHPPKKVDVEITPKFVLIEPPFPPMPLEVKLKIDSRAYDNSHPRMLPK